VPGFTVLPAQMTLSDPVMSENTDLVAADRMMENQTKDWELNNFLKCKRNTGLIQSAR